MWFKLESSVDQEPLPSRMSLCSSKTSCSLSRSPLRPGWQAPSQLTIFWFSLSWKDRICDPWTNHSKSEWSNTQAPLKVPTISLAWKRLIIYNKSKAIHLHCNHEDYEKENKGFIKETFWEKGKTLSCLLVLIVQKLMHPDLEKKSKVILFNQ